MKQFKSNNGITLIALIITIIILLILAMVTINILINQGIIGHAQNAVETYDEKQVKEDIALSYDEYKMQKFGANAKSLYDFFKDKYGAEHVTDNGDGSITVSVTSNGKTYTVKLKEDGSMESMTGLSLDKSKITLEYEEETPATDTITATLTDVSGDVTWSIADTNVATISSTTGNQITVTSVKEGTTTITVKCGKYTKTCEVNVYLKLPIGEYINYDCLADVTDTSELYYKSLKEKNGHSDQEFQVTENPKWKILGRDDNGNILITTSDTMKSVKGSGFQINYKGGYENGPEELDRISETYSHGMYSVGGRSIKVEDVLKIKPLQYSEGKDYVYTIRDSGAVYNDTTGSRVSNYHNKMDYYDEVAKEWKVISGAGSSVTIRTSGGYPYRDIKPSEIEENNGLQMLMYDDNGNTKSLYWYATRIVSSVPEWGLGQKWSSILTSHYTSNAHGGSGSNPAYVRPVVTLSSDVTIRQKVDDVWQIVQK